jgi:hypothetical protein
VQRVKHSLQGDIYAIVDMEPKPFNWDVSMYNEAMNKICDDASEVGDTSGYEDAEGCLTDQTVPSAASNTKKRKTSLPPTKEVIHEVQHLDWPDVVMKALALEDGKEESSVNQVDRCWANIWTMLKTEWVGGCWEVEYKDDSELYILRAESGDDTAFKAREDVLNHLCPSLQLTPRTLPRKRMRRQKFDSLTGMGYKANNAKGDETWTTWNRR